MFEGWDNFFVLVGTASGGLIGLLFVVITLTAGLDRNRALRASGTYMTPNVVHFAVTLVASALVLAPRISTRVDALILGGAALAGLSNAIRTCLGIVAFAREGNPPHWSDMPLYGFAPGLIYVLLLGDAVAIWSGAAFAPFALAALLMVLMLLAIRNAWDLITWMAPGVPETPPPNAR
jgi:hypothetical protein